MIDWYGKFVLWSEGIIGWQVEKVRGRIFDVFELMQWFVQWWEGQMQIVGVWVMGIGVELCWGVNFDDLFGVYDCYFV